MSERQFLDAVAVAMITSGPVVVTTAFIGYLVSGLHGTTESLAAERSAVDGALLLDVRRAGVYQQADKLLPGASWRDPAAVDQWAAELPPDREVIVYCVYGHEVGRSTALRLKARGLRARFLQGGFEGWKEAGLPLTDKMP